MLPVGPATCQRCVTYHLTEEEWCVRGPRRHLVGTHAAVSRQALATPWPRNALSPNHLHPHPPLPLSPGSQTASPVLKNSFLLLVKWVLKGGLLLVLRCKSFQLKLVSTKTKISQFVLLHTAKCAEAGVCAPIRDAFVAVMCFR